MRKVKMHTKNAHRFGQTLISSFGDITVDDKGFAMIDEDKVELAKVRGFDVILNKEKKDKAEGNKDLTGGQNTPDDITGTQDDEIEGFTEEYLPQEITAEEFEDLKISLYKKKNEELETILSQCPLLKVEDFTGKIKKDMVELILTKMFVVKKAE